jgi:glycosyltransferase involved in cell wall biosynthesis
MSPGAGGGLPVDIVVTNHDYADFVCQAVESALAQTHPRVEVIVVDDGSTDGSRERLAPYADRVTLILKENGGQASALNAGMERSRGEAVIFLDADDLLDAEAAAHVSDALAADTRLAKVQFGMDLIDAHGRPVGLSKPPPGVRPPAGDLRRAELAFPFDLPWLPGGGTAFRASALRKILPVPESEFPREGADWYLVHLTALLGDAGAIDRALARYRVHGGNRYEQEDARFDLDHVRSTVVFAAATKRALLDLAVEIEMEHPDRILSISDIGNRLLSLRLDPRRHPLPGDTVTGLLRDTAGALRRRFDQGPVGKAVLLGWVLATAIAPRALVPRLGKMLLYPQSRRSGTNRFLGRVFGGR